MILLREWCKSDSQFVILFPSCWTGSPSVKTEMHYLWFRDWAFTWRVIMSIARSIRLFYFTLFFRHDRFSCTIFTLFFLCMPGTPNKSDECNSRTLNWCWCSLLAFSMTINRMPLLARLTFPNPMFSSPQTLDEQNSLFFYSLIVVSGCVCVCTSSIFD